MPEWNLLEELSPEVERLINRHYDSAKNWYPHEQIEWGSGTSFKERAWSPEDYPLSDGIRSSIYVNLLTEDNLPYYTNTILRHTPEGHPLWDWSHQWTMEENRHSMAMRDWVHVSRCIDPALLENGRRIQMGSGIVPQHPSLAELISYVAMQERATQIAHRNTASLLPKEDKQGRSILATIAGDETKHYFFYRDLVHAALAIDPSTMLVSIKNQMANFAMPGVGIPQFSRHALRIAREGIYSLKNFLEDVVAPVMELWDIDHLMGLSDVGERAREEIHAVIAALGETVARAADRLAAKPRLA
jgi:acyl-[acyl-carrier-protein] desaturase